MGGGESDQKERLEGVKEEGAEEDGGGEEDQARARLTLTPAPWRQQSQAGIPPATSRKRAQGAKIGGAEARARARAERRILDQNKNLARERWALAMVEEK